MTSRSILFSLVYILNLTVSGLAPSPVYAQSEFFPFVAESTGESVNVRAGQSANFERVSRLSKGDEVVVLAKEFSWYKIQLPASAKSFVSKKYVQYLGKNAGGINANKVNIRAGAGIHYTVLGQLSRGEQIYILEEFEEWYRIEPVPQSYGWVLDKLLKFKSADISGFQLTRPPSTFIEEQEEALEEVAVEIEPQELDAADLWFEPIKSPEPEKKAQAKQLVEVREDIEEDMAEPKVIARPIEIKKVKITKKPARKLVKPKPQGIISAVGVIEPHEDARGNGIYYKIVADGKPVCYVQGVNHMLGRFIHHKVTVDGTVIQKFLDQYSAPVITVVKVRLML